jgi:hypothetical protein
VKWTIEKLKAMPISSRHQLYKNATTHNGPEAEELIQLLEGSGLPFSDSTPVRGDDPLVTKMYDIINSKIGVERMLAAVKDGWPPLAGVDPLIAQQLGVDYGKHNETTIWAGQLVWAKMSSLGYKKLGQRKMPDGCVARSAIAVVKA